MEFLNRKFSELPERKHVFGMFRILLINILNLVEATEIMIFIIMNMLIPSLLKYWLLFLLKYSSPLILEWKYYKNWMNASIRFSSNETESDISELLSRGPLFKILFLHLKKLFAILWIVKFNQGVIIQRKYLTSSSYRIHQL